MSRDWGHPKANASQWQHLNVGFRTVHASKGLEADFVVIPGMNTVAYGFPSTISDDPVLQLAMPEGDTFRLAEERWLFYVAMTRAKRSVLLLIIRNKESPFLTEIVKDHNLTIYSAEGKALGPTICPECREGPWSSGPHAMGRSSVATGFHNAVTP